MQIDVRGGPRRSRGVPGPGFGRKSRENRPETFQPDCLQVASLASIIPRSCEGAGIGASGRTLTRRSGRNFAGHLVPIQFPINLRPAKPCPTGYLKAIWMDIFGPVSNEFPAKTDPRAPPRSPGSAPHINVHQKSAPQTDSKAVSRHPKNPPDCLQVPSPNIALLGN